MQALNEGLGDFTEPIDKFFILEKQENVSEREKFLYLLLLSRTDPETRRSFFEHGSIETIMGSKGNPITIRMSQSLIKLMKTGLIREYEKNVDTKSLDFLIPSPTLTEDTPIRIPRILIEDTSIDWKYRLFKVKIYIIYYITYPDFMLSSISNVCQLTKLSRGAVTKYMNRLKSDGIYLNRKVDIDKLLEVPPDEYLRILDELESINEKIKYNNSLIKARQRILKNLSLLRKNEQ